MQSKLYTLISGLCLSTLIGCAVPSGTDISTKGRLELDSLVSCCQTLSELKAAKLPVAAKPTPFKMDKEEAQVFTIDSKKRFVRLFELPEFKQPYSITFSSIHQGNGTDVVAFLPRVELYDAGFKTKTRTISEEGLKTRGSVLEQTVFINPQHASERYLLIYGADMEGKIKRTTQVVSAQAISAGVGGGVFYYQNGADVTGVFGGSPVGTIMIRTNGLESKTQ